MATDDRSLHLYDSATQTVRAFTPLDERTVTMYVCGPTVQSGPHLGHLRAALAFDLLRRWLERLYGSVTFVRNVTDIDDKVLQNATVGEPWWALAYRVEQEFNAAYDAIGIRRPSYEPRATGSIPQMIDLIATLIERGHAYRAPDSADVYFDVRSWPAYGELTRQPLDQVEPSADAAEGKRDPRDFALWKASKADEHPSASWGSPWGDGRPGWHIECSAMAARYLGERFDIHGGGLDLRFPHHENELAQSRAAGDGFARYWVHNGLITVNDQKMAKSLGNFVLAADALAEHPAEVVRYALAAAHYRSTLDITESSFAEAQAALERIRGFQQRALRFLDADPFGVVRADELPSSFIDAMNDDLGVPQALAVIHETVRRGNSAIDAGARSEILHASRSVAAMLDVLGLAAGDPAATADGGAGAALSALVLDLIAQRAAARERRDWSEADRIRDTLFAAGVVLEDGATGTTWSVRPPQENPEPAA